ncbi:MAG: hypothetical protein RR194_02515, partial [Ruthenibacterium sp.]
MSYRLLFMQRLWMRSLLFKVFAGLFQKAASPPAASSRAAPRPAALLRRRQLRNGQINARERFLFAQHLH